MYGTIELSLKNANCMPSIRCALLAQLIDSKNVDAFLTAFEPMVSEVTEFFDNVLVHDPDPQLRNNRIALLQLISGMQVGLADLSELENF